MKNPTPWDAAAEAAHQAAPPGRKGQAHDFARAKRLREHVDHLERSRVYIVQIRTLDGEYERHYGPGLTIVEAERTARREFGTRAVFAVDHLEAAS